MTNACSEIDPAWIAKITAWASSVPEIERVWIFGSRVTGVRRTKEAQQPSDLDLAYSLQGGEPGELLFLSISMRQKWQERLTRELGLPVDLQLAEEDDVVVMPAVKDHGVLIYMR